LFKTLCEVEGNWQMTGAVFVGEKDYIFVKKLPDSARLSW
jgi:hypothetical protein